MKWKGTVKGDSVEGTAVWTKKGQADAIYTFKGSLKKYPSPPLVGSLA